MVHFPFTQLAGGETYCVFSEALESDVTLSSHLSLDSVMCLPAQGQEWDPLGGCLSKFLLIVGSLLISNRM